MKTAFGEKKYVKGVLSISIVDVATGNVLDSFEDENLVVTLGKTNIAKLLGGDAAGKPISKVGVGTDGTAPLVTNTSLTNGFVKSIAGATYPNDITVAFSFTIEDTEANGLTIREFALFDDDNNMFSRKTRSDIVKTSAIRLVGTWKISVA